MTLARLIFAIGVFWTVAFNVSADAADNATIEQVRDYRLAHEKEILQELIEYLAIPNHAFRAEDIQANLEFLLSAFERRGISARILETPGAPPTLYAETKSENAVMTLTVYTHLDGQPADEADWSTPPFEPALKRPPFGDDDLIEFDSSKLRANPNWRLFARSASDDKSPLIAMLAALDALRTIGESPNINLKFFVETDEEQGSPNLRRILEHHKGLFADDDFWLFADGPMHESGVQQIVFGVRGVTGAELTVYGARQPLHSGHYGNFSPNPASRLAHLLASTRDENGTILIEGIDALEAPINEESLERLRGRLKDLPSPLANLGLAAAEKPGAPREIAVLNTALNIKGLSAGAVGARARNAIPDTASASIGFRLAPGVPPAKALDLLERHIRDQGYEIVREAPSADMRLQHDKIIRVTRMDGGYPSAYTDLSDPQAVNMIRIVESVRPDFITIPIAGGSLPLFYFKDVIGAPFAIVPIANADNNQHAPDENIRLGNFFEGIELYAHILARLGNTDSIGD
ncbi:MAG: M20/M25/M40 family metallo-hydrolase [Pseudomonadota bacterium]